MQNSQLSSSLYFSEGRSDKEYHAEVVEVSSGFVVNFRYGRRGSTLTAGTKTAMPVEYEQAKNIFDKLVKEKLCKGYVADVCSTAYQCTELSGIQSDFVPQLLNPISEEEVKCLIVDTQWGVQQKMDGERRAVHADGSAEKNGVLGFNRRGLVVPLPQGIVDELQAIAIKNGAIRVDGEIIGDVLHVFDLLIHHGLHLHSLPWIERMRIASITLADGSYLKALPVAVTAKDKQYLYEKVLFDNGEGLVFKRLDSLVASGRPNSGGDWLKFKFIESASCCVTSINSGKRSVKIGLLSTNNEAAMIDVGNVTIPPNYAVPEAGDVVEVEYLYAYRGGSLYQPVYRGKRVDVDIGDCILAQLKYKPD